MASLDDVALRLDDGELLIAPGGIEPREDMMHPSLPVDGGRLCAGLGIDREIPAGYLGTAGRIGCLTDGDINAIKAILAKITR